MRLTGFNLVDCITLLNQKGVQYQPNETFNFEFFDSELLQMVNLTIESIYAGIDSNFFTQSEKDRLGENQQRTRNLLAYARGQLDEKPEILTSSAVSESLYRKSDYLFWLNDRKLQLDRLLVRENKMLEESQSTKIKKLQLEWNRRSDLICHTHRALIEAGQILAELIQYHRLAEKKLHQAKYRMPEMIYCAYRDYLSQFFKVARVLEQKIAEEMQQRLFDWEHRQAIPDVINNVVAVLANEGLIQESMPQQSQSRMNSASKIPVFRDRVTTEVLNQFHGYIQKKGNNQVNHLLKQRTWFKEVPTIFATVHHTNKKQIQLIPESLAKQIPAAMPRFKWIFKGTAFRYQFFNKRIGILAILKRSPVIYSESVEFSNSKQLKKLLNEIREQETVSQTEIEAVNKILISKKLSPVFQKNTLQFLSSWIEILESHRKLQVENKLEIAKKLGLRLMSYNQGNNVLTAIYASQECHQLNKLLEEIEENIQTYHFKDKNIIKDFIDLKSKLIRILKLNKNFQLLERLAQGEIVPDVEVNVFCHNIDFMKNENINSYRAFLNTCLPQRSMVFLNLTKAVKNFFSSSNPEAMFSYIQNLLLITLQYGETKDKLNLDSLFKKALLIYLNALNDALKRNADLDTPRLTYMHRILESMHEQMGKFFNQEILYSGIPVSTHLKILKENFHSKAVLSCKAKALRVLLVDELLKIKMFKDTNRLDFEIKQQILNDKKLGYSEFHVDKILMKLRDRAVKENKMIEQLQLGEDEKMLVGLSSEETVEVKRLINISICVHMAMQVVKNPEITFSQKILYFNHFSQKLSQLVTEAKHLDIVKKLFDPHSKHRLRFYDRSYLNPTILDVSGRIEHLSSQGFN